MAVVIRDVLVPFFGCGQRADSPQSYAEFKKIVLGWNPKYKLKEKVVAVDDKYETNKS